MKNVLRFEDFEGREYVEAIYMGKSRYLVAGESYNVTPTKNMDRVTVKLKNNPKIKMSNGGIQFMIGTFLVDSDTLQPEVVQNG